MDLQAPLKRLGNLAMADYSYFALGLHGFLEGTLRNHLNCGIERNFEDLCNLFETSETFSRGRLPYQEWKNFKKGLAMDRGCINQVRHRFDQLTPVQLGFVVRNFCNFFRNFPGLLPQQNLKTFLGEIEGLTKSLDAESLEVLRDRAAKYEKLLESDRRQIQEFEALGQKLSQLSLELETLDLERQDLQLKLKKAEADSKNLTQIQDRLQAKDQRVNELRQNIFTKTQELQNRNQEITALKTQLSSLEELRQAAEEMHILTRSHSRFLETLMEPSPEQRALLESLPPEQGNFLVTGGAGTGKSLVLLLALDRLAPQLGPGEEVPFLAFNRTLERFHHRLLQVNPGPGSTQVKAQTVDSFLREQFKTQFPDRELNYDPFPGDPDILDLIWAQGLDRETYLTIPREGMRRPRNQEARQRVWEEKEALEAQLEGQKSWPGAYAFYRLAQVPLQAQFPWILVDEVQDLSRVKLRILQSLVRRGLIMAGDREQMIFQNLKLTRDLKLLDPEIKTQVLKVSYRCTRGILELAEAYLNPGPREFSRLGLQAYREGPAPRFFIKPKMGLAETLVDHVVYLVQTLGYHPANIMIIADQRSTPELQNQLTGARIPHTSIEADSFKFEEEKGLRFSHFQTCKGLSSPVVLVYLPEAPGLKKTNDEDPEGQRQRYDHQRRLIYVAMTRASERLGLFIAQESQASQLLSLRELESTIHP